MAGDELSIVAAQQAIAGFPGLKGMDLAKEVTTAHSYAWTENVWELEGGHRSCQKLTKHVVAYDFGIKRNILRLLVNRGCRVTVVPATTSAADVLALSRMACFCPMVLAILSLARMQLKPLPSFWPLICLYSAFV